MTPMASMKLSNPTNSPQIFNRWGPKPPIFAQMVDLDQHHLHQILSPPSMMDLSQHLIPMRRIHIAGLIRNHVAYVLF